jgi:hypothetical protein
LGGEWKPGRPFGRGEIVAEFHRLRKLDQPPVIVLEGFRGHAKSQLIDYLLYSFGRRGAWRMAHDVKAKIDFVAVNPDPASTFASLSNQLSKDSSLLRALRSPRLDRLRVHLAREQTPGAVGPVDTSAAAQDRQWFMNAGGRIASTLSQVPIPALSRTAGPGRWLRDLWWLCSPTKAGRWVRAYLRQLPDRGDAPTSLNDRLDILLDGLGAALAADLQRATRRHILPIHQVAIFVDSYQNVERSARPGYVVDFANLVAEMGARVVITVACRNQQRWTRLAEAQDDFRDYDVLKTSSRVHIHHLQPLAWSDRIQALQKYEVPPEQVGICAEKSAGMPVGLEMLGALFGRRNLATRRVEDLLADVPDPHRVDQEWFDRFSAKIAGELVFELDRDLELHLRAAASVRNFDEQLLKRLLGSSFSDRLYRELVESTFVGTPRPAPILGTDASYRVRSSVRKILADDGSERTKVELWHQRAHDYFSHRAPKASDPDLRFQLEVEALFHRLFSEPETARKELFDRFEKQLLANRTGACETLLRAALDYDNSDPRWRARILAHAGQMYLARDQPVLAGERLREAKQLVSLDDAEDSDLAVSIVLGLAKCYRVQDDHARVREEFDLLTTQSNVHPLVAFQSKWTQALIAKGAGEIELASSQAAQARALLNDLLDSPDADDHAAMAHRLGMGPLRLKRGHLARHEADVARYAGDYVTSLAKVAEAQALYRGDPASEDGIEDYTVLPLANVLRLEGSTEEAIALSRRILDRFLERTPQDRRGAGQAQRALAHALLCSSDPEQARPLLEELAEMDSAIYPSGLPFGQFGLGELARLAGDIDAAYAHYRESAEWRVGALRGHFQRYYAWIGLAILDQIARPQDVEKRVVRLLSQPGVIEHPSLDFHAQLLRLRAYGPDDRLVEAARRAASRFVRRPEDRNWEGRLLDANLAALEAGRPLPPIVLNLP